MFKVPDPGTVDPLLPQVVRGVRRGCRWLRWHLRDRWAFKREGWRKDGDGWWPPDG